MTAAANHVIVSGGFDDVRLPDVRFLEEASRLGSLHVLLWTDEMLRERTGGDPKFPLSERQYFVQAVRYVHQAHAVHDPAELQALAGQWPDSIRVVREGEAAEADRQGLDHRIVPESDLDQPRSTGILPVTEESWAGRPCYDETDDLQDARDAERAGRRKVMVTGCYDWLHTGHIRFFEEVSALGDLYVVVGHDANIRLLKGEGHPLFDERVRRYMVGSIRYVTQALVSSGHGWLDAEPEIERIRPDIYAVNEDGDKPEKREYCEKHGIEYVVLKRLPKEGLPRRESTKLRGF